ncbi:MAG TPA: carboxypeptidase-like regulatory domain-containing protein [Gemmatimonadales bacterium]|nr:carboxypeptidase-like regulatory domain-containing protein [Gemmatimonadales bacterium]
MSLHSISPRWIRVNRARAIARRVTSGGATLVLLLLAACGDSSGPDGGGPGPDGGGGGATLSGTVRAAGSAAALGDATVSIGARQATSDAEGRYELTDLPTGATTVRAERPGYMPAEAAITITAGANSHDFTLTPQDIYVFGTNAVYVPAGVGPMRAAIVVLGGPVASGFVTGERLAPADAPPDLEPGLQALGAGLRALARSARVALLGSKTTGMGNSITSDNALFQALRTAAQMSGHPELADAPVLMFGLSGGGPEAAGLASRHPERAVGLLVRVPSDVTALTASAALAVPTFVMQAELDEVVDNTRVRTTFSGNRSRGGLWALAVEPAVGHRVASTLGNGVAISWITTALELRLPTTSGEPLIALDEPSGWLGNPTTLEIAPWAEYPGDRSAASWLLSESAATSWKDLGTPAGLD